MKTDLKRFKEMSKAVIQLQFAKFHKLFRNKNQSIAIFSVNKK
jgi:hypothetical protein